MRACAWTCVVGGGLCLAFLGCSATSGGSGVGAGNSNSTGAQGTGATVSFGGLGTGASLAFGGDQANGGADGVVCMEGGVQFVPKVPTVMLMVDRSGTMFTNGGNPWGTLRDGVLPVVQELDAKVRFGFMAVTGEVGMCPLLDEVAPSDNGFAAVSAEYTRLAKPTKGESPGMLGLQRAHEVLAADLAEGDKYILFVTDGEQDYCGDGNVICPTDSVVYWLQKLKALGVTTFVFGLPSSGDQTAYAAILQAFANAGAGQPVAPAVGPGQTQLDIYNQCFYGGDANAAGWKAEYATAGTKDDPLTTAVDEGKVPLASYAAAGGTAKVYKPDPTDQAALAEEFRTVLAGVKSCTFDLGGEVKVKLSRLGEANVYVDGAEVRLDEVNGWHMNSPTQLALVGAACEEWRALSAGEVTWNFPCAIVEPK